MEKEKTKIYQKWWFWLCILIVVIAIVGGSTLYLNTISINVNLDKKVTIQKLTYYIDESWENKENINENVTYKYYYPTKKTMLMIMVDKNDGYDVTSDMNSLLESYIEGLGLSKNDLISKEQKKISGHNCGVVRCYINENETIQYIILNKNEAYVFGFGQEKKLDNKYIDLVENIIKKANIIQETEEEKQARLEQERIEKEQREREEKARKEREEIEKKAKAEREEKEFKTSCKNYTYEQMARNPDKFKGTNVKLTGEVIQALYDSDSVDLRVNITKKGSYSTYYMDTVYIVYYPEVGEDKILEDDIITIYGTSQGDYTYTSTIGSRVTLPLIYGKYITINK